MKYFGRLRTRKLSLLCVPKFQLLKLVVWSQKYRMLPKSHMSFSGGGQNKMVILATVSDFVTPQLNQIMAYKFKFIIRKFHVNDSFLRSGFIKQDAYLMLNALCLFGLYQTTRFLSTLIKYFGPVSEGVCDVVPNLFRFKLGHFFISVHATKNFLLRSQIIISGQNLHALADKNVPMGHFDCTENNCQNFPFTSILCFV